MKAYRSPTSGLYVLEMPVKSKKDVARAMSYRGMSFSTSASQRHTAILFSGNPYSICDLADDNDPDLGPYKREINLSRALDGKGTHRLPPGKELWDYQKATLDYLVARNGGIDADEPGLGKTPTSIAFCNEVEARRVLVIVPASVRIQWGIRIKEWSNLPNVSVSVMLRVKDGIHPTANYQVISYEAARNPAIMRAIAHGRWDVLICDEAHKMKSADALVTRAVLGNSRGEFQRQGHETVKCIAHYCDRSVALTGTPLLNRPSECLDGSTLVLTNRGWVPIVKVRKTDLLWDGVEWVEHHGLLYQGYASTVNVGQISATRTHRFLGKYTWVSAAEAHQNSDFLNQLLERGSANLPLNVGKGITAAAGFVCAIVSVAEKLAQHSKNYVKALFSGVGHAVQKVSRANTLKFALIQSYAPDYSQSLGRSEIAPQIPKIFHSNHTGAGVSGFGLLGRKIERSLWHILFRYQTMKNQVWNLIGLITTKGMSPEISDLCRNRKTWQIDVLSMKSKHGSTRPWRRSKCSKPVWDLANAGPRRRFTILSAQGPVISHNCYVLFRHFDWESINFMTEDQFKEKYNRQANLKTIEGKHFKLESTSLELELQNKLRVNIMARHEKADVFKQMKIPRFAIVSCMENGEVKAALDVEGMLGLDIDDIQTTTKFEILGHISEARRLMGEALAPQVCGYVADLLDGGEQKYVLFGWHLSVLEIYAKELAQYGTVMLHGGKSPAVRQKAIDDFISNPNIRVFIANIQAGGEGVDGLQTVCSRCGLGEPDWVPARNDQAVSRLDRIGQKYQVSADVFVAPGSIAEKIMVKSLEKLNTIHRVLDEKGNVK